MDDLVLMEFLSSEDDEEDTILLSTVQAAIQLTNSVLKIIPERSKRTRIANYLEETVSGYSDDLFKEHFRMSRETMEVLFGIVARALPTKSTIKNDISRNVLFCIWLLSKQESFLGVGDRFGLAKSTAYRVFTAIIEAIAKQVPTYIKWPDHNKQNHTALIFQRRSRGFPGAVGAIDGCHITIKAPTGNPIDFYNRHKSHSIILQGTCDHKERFIDIFVGMPGRMHDARAFRHSGLGKKIMDERNPLLPPNLHLLGDSAYPLMTNLVTPFRDNGRLTPQEINYNVKLSSIRSIIERAFGHLKGKFRRLKYLDIATPLLGNQIIVACCVLHNFLIKHNEFNFEQDNIENMNSDLLENNNASNTGDSTNPGIAKRNSIAENLCMN